MNPIIEKYVTTELRRRSAGIDALIFAVLPGWVRTMRYSALPLSWRNFLMRQICSWYGIEIRSYLSNATGMMREYIEVWKRGKMAGSIEWNEFGSAFIKTDPHHEAPIEK